MSVKLLRSLGLFSALTIAVALGGCASMDRDDRGDIPLNGKILSEMSSKGMTPADPIMVRIYKQESELEVWKRTSSGSYALLKTYPMCRWSGKLGPKTREGDRQAPEGFYTVTRGQLNPRSQYFLSFNLGYPNQLEQALGYSGSALMVHGACTSAGCYAMTDDQVGEIYAIAREALAGGQGGFQVQALPFRMTQANFATYRNDPNMPFWRNLREGTRQFDTTRQPPVVSACGGRYRFTDGSNPADAMLDPLAPCPVAPGSIEMSQALDQNQNDDFAGLMETNAPASAPRYVDGGMHKSFRDMLRRSGPERMAAMTSSKIPVSQPDAALADPYPGSVTVSSAH